VGFEGAGYRERGAILHLSISTAPNTPAAWKLKACLSNLAAEQTTSKKFKHDMVL
jgi:hypothetical protein